ncbi:MAG: hypothetical protein K5678_05290 [Acetatifactor sp.]|nr:hypothetical protein [Acetatifactor sp.]
MSDTSLEALDLGVRAYNSLKRAGYNTIGDVVDAISSGSDLKSIRNCGKTCVREIMEHLFCSSIIRFRQMSRMGI